jgi:predicted nuclease of predicted toxin-antitoxin system
MRFLGDMGVSQRVVEWLRATGHEAVHLRDEGLHRLPNGDIFRKGFDEQRIVLTFDLDFGEMFDGIPTQVHALRALTLSTRGPFVTLIAHWVDSTAWIFSRNAGRMGST